MRLSAIAAAAALCIALAVALAACGGSDNEGATDYVPAAGANTPPDTTPGVEPGSSYDLSGNEWLKLPEEKRFTAAQDFVADHPDDCRNGAGRDASGDSVRDWADDNLGTDFPLNEPVAELLAEGCAAALQSSGEEELAPAN